MYVTLGAAYVGGQPDPILGSLAGSIQPSNSLQRQRERLELRLIELGVPNPEQRAAQLLQGARR